MAFKLRSGNKVNFKEIGSSPFRAEGESKVNSAGNFDWLNNDSTPEISAPDENATVENVSNKAKLGDLSQAKFENEQEVKETEEDEGRIEVRKYNKSKGQEGKIDTTGPESPPKEEKWFEKQAWKDSGIGHMVAAVNSIRKGIKNNKAKRTKKVEDARTASGSGTETLKQAKLVDRANARDARKAKRAAKDKKKLAEYKAKRKTKSKS